VFGLLRIEDWSLAQIEGTSERMRALVEAGMALASEITLDALLQRLVEISAELTAARYAALGVTNHAGTALDRFITTGIGEELRKTIGDLPRGRGILGLLIHEQQALRLHDLSEHPASVGFPPGHPPMRSFLGVPVQLRGVAFGNLYLCEKAGGGDFSEEDEELVSLLAAQAAIAIENTRLYESATHWLRQVETLNEVGNAMLEEVDLPRLLALVALRLRELVGARLVVIALPSETGQLRIEATDGGGGESLVGRSRDLEHTKVGRVFARRRSERVDSLVDDPEVDRESLLQIVEATGIMPRTALYAPLIKRDRSVGLIAVYDRDGQDPRFRDSDQRLAETFADRAAVAVDLSQRVARDTLRRIVQGQETERARMARELHDQTGQALTSILLGLRAIEDADADEIHGRVAGLRDLVTEALQDVRRLAVDLRPTTLDDFGVVTAIERLCGDVAAKSWILVAFHATREVDRMPREVESCLYRVVQEALTNVIKHAGAEHVSVLLAPGDRDLRLIVEDDGAGFDPAGVPSERLGLVGMRERVALVGGSLMVESAPGAGTTLRVTVPLGTGSTE
jgi:signal transduction histidine kinase